MDVIHRAAQLTKRTAACAETFELGGEESFQAGRRRKSEKKVDRWCIHDPATHFNWATEI